MDEQARVLQRPKPDKGRLTAEVYESEGELQILFQRYGSRGGVWSLTIVPRDLLAEALQLLDDELAARTEKIHGDIIEWLKASAESGIVCRDTILEWDGSYWVVHRIFGIRKELWSGVSFEEGIQELFKVR